MVDEVVVVAEESYGTGNLERYYKFADESGILKRIKTKRETSVTSISQFFKSAFLPQGYPESVSQDYLQYQIWDSLQAFCSSITGTLATQAMLKGYGVGDENATALAATITWIMRSGTGMMGSILFAWFQGNNLDCYSKKWRLFADAMNDTAILLELVTPLFKSYFTFLAILSSVAKSIVGVAGGATKAAFTQHQARRDNMADVSAKDGSQETMVNLTALVAGLIITPLVSGNVLLTWSLFLIFTFLHLYSNYRAVCAVIIETLNIPRLNIVVNEFLDSGNILPPDEVSKKEPVFFGFDTGQCLKINLGTEFCRVVTSIQDFQSALPDNKASKYLMRLQLNSENKGGIVNIVLHRESESIDQIQCCFQAAVLDYVIHSSLQAQQSVSCGNVAGQRAFEAMKNYWNRERMTSEDCAWHMVALAHNFTLQTFPELLTGLEDSGWVTSRTHLGSQEWRATWNLRGLEAKKIL